MKLKICGIRNKAMVDFCHKNKVDFCGFNFVPTSKRKTTVGLVQNLPAHFAPKKVALFMDQPLTKVDEILAQISAEILQLHGQETIKYIQQIKEKYPDLVIWKAFCIHDEFDTSTLDEYKDHIDLFLFDAANPGSGKTVQSTESLTQAINYCNQHKIPYAIAGGIKTTNIKDFKDKFPKAKCLDTASGIEVDGHFDLHTAETLITSFLSSPQPHRRSRKAPPEPEGNSQRPQRVPTRYR